MTDDRDEESQLRSVALQNAQTILATRRKSEDELLAAKFALESKTDELAHSVAMLHATLEATTEGILVTDDAGAIVDFNEKYLNFWNIPTQLRAQKTPRSALEFVANEFADPAAFISRVDRIYASSPPESFDILHLLDGRICERYSRVQVVRGRNVGRVWTFRDVTQQRRVEYALREEGRILELLNKIGTTIASNLDLESLLQVVTDAATELSGGKYGAFFYNRVDGGSGELVLHALSGAPRTAFSPFESARVTPILAPTFRGEAPVRSDDILSDPRYGQLSPHHGLPADHLPVRSYLAVPVVSRSGEVIGGLLLGHPEVGVFTERSERIITGVAAQAAVAIDNARLYEAAQKSASERAQLLESEREARAIAEQQNRSKDAFLAMLGHELRNPLSAISAGVAVIKAAGPTSEKAVLAHEIIARQSAHLERIVDDLLDTARMLAGKVTLETGRVDLAEAVNACLRALDATGKTLPYTLTVRAEPCALEADPARIDQIINNLLTNAFRYTPEGGAIAISVSVDGEQAVLNVSDTGIGIPPELIDHLFDPFVQGERALDRSQGGLGIGLTLVRKLVELHGGSVRAESRGEGHGSTFTVRFPLARVAHLMADVTHIAPRASSGSVLIVEDNPDALEMTSAVLELFGYRVLQAKCGAEGLDVARLHNPDVAIIDIGLPDVNGYELARQLQNNETTCQIRLIALTGYGAPEDIEKALAAGFSIHLVKPLNFDRLVRAVEESMTAA